MSFTKFSLENFPQKFYTFVYTYYWKILQIAVDDAKIVLIVGVDLYTKLRVDGSTGDSEVKELAAKSNIKDAFSDAHDWECSSAFLFPAHSR